MAVASYAPTRARSPATETDHPKLSISAPSLATSFCSSVQALPLLPKT